MQPVVTSQTHTFYTQKLPLGGNTREHRAHYQVETRTTHRYTGKVAIHGWSVTRADVTGAIGVLGLDTHESVDERDREEVF